jgi:hypothetical protein
MAFNGFALRYERSAANNHEPVPEKEDPTHEDDHEGNYLWCSRCKREFLRKPRANVCPCGSHLGG